MRVLVALCLLCVSPMCYSMPSEKPVVKFVVPGVEGAFFWRDVTAVMNAVADDVGLSIKHYYCEGDRHSYVKTAKQALDDGPTDYLLFCEVRLATPKIVAMASEKKVNCFHFCGRLLDEDVEKLGQPRERNPYLLGNMYPDDVNGGYQLGKALISAARDAKRFGKDGKIHVVGLSGSRGGDSLDRNSGLERAVRECPDAALEQILFCDWDPKVAGKRVSRLLVRYPELAVIWSASDEMALAAVESVKAAGKKPGSEVFLGGHDWSAPAIASIKRHELTATVGGHFLQGAYILPMIADHANGLDFPPTKSGQYVYPFAMARIGSDNLGKYAALVNGAPNWSAVDFKSFSRKLNVARKDYEYDLLTIIEQAH